MKIYDLIPKDIKKLKMFKLQRFQDLEKMKSLKMQLILKKFCKNFFLECLLRKMLKFCMKKLKL